MPRLRRRTGTILASVCLAATLTASVPAMMALATRPETRWPALGGWALLGAGLHALAGERVSAGSLAFAAGLTLPLVVTALAAYEVHVRYGVPKVVGFGAVAAVLVLLGIVFFRALIASGSADYPYDD